MDWRALLSRKVAGIPVVLIALVLAAAALYAAIRLKPKADAEDETMGDDEDSGDVSDDQPTFIANRNARGQTYSVDEWEPLPPPEITPLDPIDAPDKTPLRQPKPATRQGTPPLTHVVRGESDSSAPELSRLYYRVQTPASVNLIQAANPALVGKAHPPGTRIRIPNYHKPSYFRATSATRTVQSIAAKNSRTPASIRELNPKVDFPVRAGTRVRVR